MKDFDKLINDCLYEITSVGIRPGNITEWKINRRSKERWGMCTKKPNGECIIQISARLLEDDNISEKACKDTIIHEILHSCPECKGHTGKWKEYALLMNRTYGYNIKRVTSGHEKGIEDYHVTRHLEIKYVFRCSCCGNTIFKKKKCKFTRYYRNYICLICGKAHTFEKISY